ncbi:MAG: hypothetical protein ACYC6A_01520 [Armatimonadota bacterium]
MKHPPRIGMTTIRFHGESRPGFVFPRLWGRQFLAVAFIWVLAACAAWMGWSLTRAGHLPAWYRIHDWEGLLLGVVGTPLLVLCAGWVTWALFRREGQLTLLPEGVLRPGLGLPSVIPWREITAVMMDEVQMGRRRVPSLRLRVRHPESVRMSPAARWLTTNWEDPQLFTIAVAGLASPETIHLAILHYVEGGGKTATIGTAWGLALLEAALGLGDAGEPPARIPQADVPYLDIPSLAITFPRTEGESSLGVVLSPYGVWYERPEPYGIPWLHVANIELCEKDGVPCLHLAEMTDMAEIERFLDAGHRPKHTIRHVLPLTGFAFPADLIEAVVRYYRFGGGDTIPIGVKSNVLRLNCDFGLAAPGEVERAELEEWLIHVAYYPVGPDRDGDETDAAARSWALRAPYSELAVLLDVISTERSFPEAAAYDNGIWDYSLSVLLAYWGQRDIPRFLDMAGPYLRSPNARPALLMACGQLGAATLPWLRPQVEEASELPEEDAELLVDALREIGDAEAQSLLRRLLEVRPGIAAYYSH